MTERKVIILSPQSWGPPAAGAVPNTPYDADCGHKCWIGMSTLGHILAGKVDDFETSCMPCAGISQQKLYEMAREGKVMTLPGVREEVEKNLGKNVTAGMFKEFNVQEMDLP